MRCPDCGIEDGDVKWFLRHQKSDENDTATNANVITILCVKCGKNNSVFIEDYLGSFFPEWDEEREQLEQLFEQFSNSNTMENLEGLEEPLEIEGKIEEDSDLEKESDSENEL